MSKPWPEFQKALWVPLYQKEHTREMEKRWCEGYAEAAHFFDAVALCLPSFLQVPNALDHEVVYAHIEAIRHAGLKQLHGRRLWVDDSRVNRAQGACDFMRPEYYTAALNRIHGEASGLCTHRGLLDVGTVIDAEIYGDSPYKNTFRRNEGQMSAADFDSMLYAVNAGSQFADQVDFVTGCDSSGPLNYIWPLSKLGRKGWSHKTYTKVDPTENLHRNQPADWALPPLTGWGVYITTNDAAPDGRWTFDGLTNFPAAAIREQFPECRSLMFHMDHESLADDEIRPGMDRFRKFAQEWKAS